MRKKSLIRRLIPWIIALVALAALIIFVFIPLYSVEEKTFGRETEVYYYDGNLLQFRSVFLCDVFEDLESLMSCDDVS